MEKEELCFVTEVGAFGDLNIEDPTAKKTKKKNTEDLEALIEAANAENLSTLSSIME